MATIKKSKAKTLAAKKEPVKRFYVRFTFSTRMKDYGFSLHDRKVKNHETNPVLTKGGYETKSTASSGRKRLFDALGIPVEKYEVQKDWFNI